MKKLIFIMLALFSISAVTYAAFPVHSDSSQQTVIVQDELIPAQSGPDIDITLLILCLLGGGIGLHRFYMGDITNGILMLLTLGGCGIWALIDLIKILQGKMKS